MFGRYIKPGLVLTLFKKMRLSEDFISLNLNLGSCVLPHMMVIFYKQDSWRCLITFYLGKFKFLQ